MLVARDIDVSEEVRARIAGCTDLEQLEERIQRAVTVESAQQLFD